MSKHGEYFQKRRKEGTQELSLISLTAFSEKNIETVFVKCRKHLINNSQGRFVQNQFVQLVYVWHVRR